MESSGPNFPRPENFCQRRGEISGGGLVGALLETRILSQKAADVWKKDVWGFQAFSQTFFELQFSLGNEGKKGKNLSSQTWPGSPRRPSPRHPRPPDCQFPAMTNINILPFPSTQSFAVSKISTSTTLSLWPIPSHGPIDLYLSYIIKPFLGGYSLFWLYERSWKHLLSLQLRSPKACS